MRRQPGSKTVTKGPHLWRGGGAAGLVLLGGGVGAAGGAGCVAGVAWAKLVDDAVVCETGGEVGEGPGEEAD